MKRPVDNLGFFLAKMPIFDTSYFIIQFHYKWHYKKSKELRKAHGPGFEFLDKDIRVL